MKISINIDMPKEGKKEYTRPSLSDKVLEYISICESDEESQYHFQYLKNVYEKLINKNNLPECYHDMMAELNDFMVKYSGTAANDNYPKMDGVNMFKYRSK